VTVPLLPANDRRPDDRGEDDRALVPAPVPAPVPATPRGGRVDAPPLIELTRLRLRTRAPHDQIDLAVWRGEMVMLTGQPRSGRSGLLNVLGLLDRPAAGSYLLNGLNTAKLSDRDCSALRAREIGFVFQRKLLLPTRSVLDNVMLPQRYLGARPAQRLRAAMESLDQVGLTATAQLMTWQLSADELALCAIARALVNNPSLLLCDDPTAGLDEDTAARVVGLMAGLHREGRTLVLATADQLAAAYSSRSISLGQARPVVTTAVPTQPTIADSQTGFPR
jgi:putative ABC transport system ATP-binding protein